MIVGRKDRETLRALAVKVAEIAALPVQQQTISLWKALNGLKPVRPMVTIDQVCWHEMDVDGELALKTEGDFCREIETRLRRTLYQWRHMRADMVVEPFMEMQKVIRTDGYGITTQEKTAVRDPRNDVVGHLYLDQLKTERDVEKIHAPNVELDKAATAEVEEKARELFNGILEVRMQGWLPAFAPWDAITTWRGAENVLFDLADRPQFMHRIISRLTDAYLVALDRHEQQGLLGWGQGTIHCTGAYTDELPAAGFDPGRPRAKDLWTFGMAQVFSGASPAMHKEYDIDYAVRWYDRFGLGYYGCCEPLHEKIDIVRAIPHVRKISMSPWVNAEKGARQIGRDYVFSRKPSPAFLAGDAWNPGAVEKDLRDIRAICDRHGCPLELILKDISTVNYQPKRLWQWADIARQVVEE